MINVIVTQLYGDKLDSNVLELNASDDKGLPIINNTIYPFCRKKKDKHKLIILDEADTITKKAQNLLSNILSEFINSTRFVFICNDCYQIIESIQSKSMIIKYPKITLEDLYIKVKYICECENITYTEEGIKCLLYVSMQDIRQVINNLECIYYSVNTLTESNIYKLIDKPKSYYINNLLNACFENKFEDNGIMDARLAWLPGRKRLSSKKNALLHTLLNFLHRGTPRLPVHHSQGLTVTLQARTPAALCVSLVESL